jgi:hypothetical protein
MSKGKSTQSVSLPAYQEAQAKELFQAGKSLAGTPFVPYTGPRVAGFNPDQLRQFQATRGLFETGGSRSALLESESQRPYIEQQARTAAGLRQAGFEQAQRAAESDIARQQQMAMFAPELELRARQQQAGLLGGVGAEQMARLGQLGQIGAQQQQLQQMGLQVPYEEFQRALAYGPQQFGLLAAGQTGQTPITTTKQKTGLGDVLGTAAQLYGLTLLPGSDARMKKDITFVGKEKGHNIYTWNWKDEAKEMGWGNFPTIGVLAQEVKKYMPEAVIEDENGYYRVNYGVL